MDELIQAPPATARELPSLPRTNHLLQGVLSFLAVVGIGTAVTLVLRPPVQLRVITVEKRIPVPMAAPPQPPLERAVQPEIKAEPPRPHRPPQLAQLAKPAPKAKPLPKSDECKDPLCGLGDLKQ